MDYEDEDLKIEVKTKNLEKVLANVNISFRTTGYGFVTIKDFIIWKSPHLNERLGERINITPPQRRHFNKYLELAFLESRESWYELEDKIFIAYTAKTSNEEHINLDEIPDL